VESFHGGLGIEQSWGRLSLSLQPAFQFLHINRWSTKKTHVTVWNTLNSEYHVFESIKIIFDHRYKMIVTENADQTTKTPSLIFSPAIRYNDDRILFQAGVVSHDSSLTPVGLARYKWKNLYLSVSKNYNVEFKPIESSDFQLVPYSTDAVKVGYEHENINSNIEYFHTQFDVGSHLGFIGKADINLSWLNLTQSAGIYNFDNDSNTQPVDLFLLTKMIFSPNIWPWKTSRYQPFVGMESVYVQYSGKRGIDPRQQDLFSNEIFDPFSSHLLNLECGVLVSAFKVSYRWVNFNLMDTKVTNSVNPSSYPIPPIRHLQVVWQFLD